MQCSTGRVKSSRANRTSKGAEKWLDVQEHRHGTAVCIQYLKACGFRVLVTQLTQDSVPIHDVDLTQPTAFILGNEVDGGSSSQRIISQGCLMRLEWVLASD